MYESEKDNLLDDSVKVIIQYDRVSASLLQRRLSIGYARAARIIDQLESLKLIDENNGTANPRQVFVKSFDEYKKININEHIVGANELPKIEDNYEPQKALFLPNEFDEYNNPDELILGVDTQSKKAVSVKFTEIGNLIVTGTPISKKVEFIENYLISVLSNLRVSQLNLIVYDGSSYLKIFGKTPHLLCPVITDFDKIISALRWTLAEIDRRTKLTIEKGSLIFPKIVVIINDPYFDAEIQDVLKRITSIGTKVEVHIILVADTVRDIPKAIRDNIPARLDFFSTGENVAKFDFREHLILDTFVLNNKNIRDYLDELKTS